jgi:hemerythrin-like domain-containing protein
MGSSNAPWADAPFALIPSPGRGENLQKLDDAVFIARDMANAHNGMLRALNSIYQQCMHVKEPKDVKDLLLYATFWCDWIHEHHTGEETFLFPQIEEITGVKGLMEVNVAQHHAFMEGLEAFHKYAKETKVEEYDGLKLKLLIDRFGGKLTKHLTEEIGTLLSLKTYDGPALKKAYLKFDGEMRKGEKVSETSKIEGLLLTVGRVYCIRLFLVRLTTVMKRASNGLKYQGLFELLCIIGSRGNIRAFGGFVHRPRGESVDLSCLQKSRVE